MEEQDRTRKLNREIAIKHNTVANIQTEEVIEMNRQRCLTNNPMWEKTTAEITLFNPHSRPVIIAYEDGRAESYNSIKESARGMGLSESTLKYRTRLCDGKMINRWSVTKVGFCEG